MLELRLPIGQTPSCSMLSVHCQKSRRHHASTEFALTKSASKLYRRVHLARHRLRSCLRLYLHASVNSVNFAHVCLQIVMPPPPTDQPKTSSSNVGIVVGVTVAAVTLVAVIAAVAIWWFKFRAHRNAPPVFPANSDAPTGVHRILHIFSMLAQVSELRNKLALGVA